MGTIYENYSNDVALIRGLNSWKWVEVSNAQHEIMLKAMDSRWMSCLQIARAIRLPASLFFDKIFRKTKRENVLSRQLLQIWIERYQFVLTDTLDYPFVDDCYGTSLFVPFYEKEKKWKRNN